MAEAADVDPRGTIAAGERDVLPVVSRPRAGPSGLMIAGGAVAAGLILFTVLDARRRSLSAPTVSSRQVEAAVSAAPPPLYIPPPPPEPVYRLEPPRPAAPPASATPITPQTQPPAPASPPPAYAVQQVPAQTPAPPPRTAGGPTLVVDATQGTAAGGATEANAAGTGGAASAATNRARAGMFSNRATTVPQGTLIPVVLETAFDSTRPGFARGLVQRDIRGFDGTRVLIPRGSRLIGEYGAEAAPGQKRATIAWARLIRPDGVTIAIASPAADPIGRGGVRADVDNHFWERFGGAILQSSLDVGVNLASRAGDGSVIVALPNSAQGTGLAISRATQVRPTLRVPQGTSISVFVARDLDFTDVETR